MGRGSGAKNTRQVDLVDLSSRLNWKQFESLATFAFESFGFKVFKNYRLKKPVMEVDLVASRGSTAFAADCKHWKRAGGSASLLRVAEKQVVRSMRVCQAENYVQVTPVIITWRGSSEILENGVPVVPVEQLSDFILNFDPSTSGTCLVRASDAKVKFRINKLKTKESGQQILPF